MGDAFVCDRCDQFESGDSHLLLQESHKGRCFNPWGKITHNPHEVELCKQCALDLMRWWKMPNTHNDLLEELAALEHDQWVEWSKNLADSEPISEPRLNRWEDYWCDYSELEEDVKEKDRELAKDVIEVLHKMPEIEITIHNDSLD